MTQPLNPLRFQRPITGGSIAAALFLVISLVVSAMLIRDALQPPVTPTGDPSAQATNTSIVITSDSGVTAGPEDTAAPVTPSPYAENLIALAALPSGDAALSQPLLDALTTALADSPLRYSTVVRANISLSHLPAAADLAADTDMVIAWEAGEDELIKVYLIAASHAPMLQVDSAPTPWNVLSPEGIAIYSAADEFAFIAEAALAIIEMQAGQIESAEHSLEQVRLGFSALPAPYGASQHQTLVFLEGVLATPDQDVIALGSFSENMRADEQFVAARINRGNVYLRLGDPVSALRDYEAVLAQDPERVEALYNEAVAYEQLGDLDSALLVTLDLVRSLPDAAWVVNLEGGIHYRQGEWKQAAEAFHRAHNLAPRSEIPLFNLGRAEYQSGDYEAAISAYDTLLEFAPKNAFYHLHHALAYEAANHLVFAERALNQAIRLDPDYIDAYLRRGKLHLRAGRYPQANADAEMAISLNADDGRGYALRGDVLLAQHEWWDATEAYTDAINAGYTSSEVYAGRGWAWHQLRYTPYAVRDYEKAIELGDSDPELVFYLGFALLDVGRYEDALEALGGAINAGVETPEAYAVLALALDANAQREEAETAYARAIELDGQYSDLEFLADQPLWSQASINRARTILARLP